MSIRRSDPFEDLSLKLNLGVNPYVSKLASNAKTGELPIKYGPFLRGMQGNWRQHFADRLGEKPSTLTLEIGCHVGHTMKELGEAFPHDAFIGMDITFKRVFTTAENAHKKNLKNIEAILADGKHLKSLFAPDELDGIFMFFPDPWEKKKSQQHNRLINDEFCEIIFDCVKTGGFFWLKTDHKEYFTAASHSLRSAGWTPHQSQPKFFDLPLKTKFEKRFESQGIQKNEGIWQKQPIANS